MPFKDAEKRKEKDREYSRKRREAMSDDERAMERETARNYMATRRNNLSDDEKRLFYEHCSILNKKRYAHDASFRNRRSINSATLYRVKRLQVIDYLGGRCSNSDCKWINDDGTIGCIDIRCLQIDHVNSNGAELRKRGEDITHFAYHNKILKTVPGVEYQLLCANCNWIKRSVNGETAKSKYIGGSWDTANLKYVVKREE